MTGNTHPIEQLLQQRILILDGAMGTMIQRYKLTEEHYRGITLYGEYAGERKTFAGHEVDVKGNNDLLLLTQPHIIGGIHREYLEAGADILETCTFNSTSVSMADYEMQHLVYELNVAGARLARGLCDEFSTPDKPRFVAGVLGPTGRTASISPDVNDPGARNITFDELVESYTEAIRGLLDGGADILMVETIFDTLNAKAALFAIECYFERHGMAQGVPECLGGLARKSSAGSIGDRAGDHYWNAHAVLLEMPLDGEQRGLGVQRVENGLDHQGICAAIQQTAHGFGVAFHQLVEGDVARARIVDVRRDRCGAPGRAEHARDEARFVRRGEFIA